MEIWQPLFGAECWEKIKSRFFIALGRLTRFDSLKFEFLKRFWNLRSVPLSFLALPRRCRSSRSPSPPPATWSAARASSSSATPSWGTSTRTSSTSSTGEGRMAEEDRPGQSKSRVLCVFLVEPLLVNIYPTKLPVSLQTGDFVRPEKRPSPASFVGWFCIYVIGILSRVYSTFPPQRS